MLYDRAGGWRAGAPGAGGERHDHRRLYAAGRAGEQQRHGAGDERGHQDPHPGPPEYDGAQRRDQHRRCGQHGARPSITGFNYNQDYLTFGAYRRGGIYVTGTDNWITGNFIGLLPDGSAASDQNAYGVDISGGHRNTVGVRHRPTWRT
ncbi:MAG: hypothetical protein U0232_20815 [Thermomicrobiales bacterium]